MNKNFRKVLVAIMLLPTLFFIGCNDDEPITASKPSVDSSVPANDAVGVAINTTIAFTFNEEMDASTINETNVTLKEGTTSVTGSVTYSNK
jgi:hypothetical protein